MAVPLLTGAALFFFIPPGVADLNNPYLPVGFRLFKDVAFACAVLIPFCLALDTRRTVPTAVGFHLVLPVFLVALVLFISILKSDVGFMPAGQLRNMALYFGGGGLVALLARWLGYELHLFRYFRMLMVLSVLLGLSFYAFADDINRYTVHRRMIGTVANPNFLGYFCLIQIALINASLGHQPFTKRTLAELVLALVALVLSGSSVAALCYLVWLVLVAFLCRARAIPATDALRRAIRFQTVLGTVTVVLVLIGVAAATRLETFGKVIAAFEGTTDSTSVRMADFGKLFDGLSDPKTFLIGQVVSPRYVGFDGSAPSLLYNLGMPFFVVWLIYFTFPIMTAIRAWGECLRRSRPQDFAVMMLVPFLIVSVGIEFWVQYIPEVYPPCVILGWIMGFVLMNTTGRLGVLGGVTRAGVRVLQPSSRYGLTPNTRPITGSLLSQTNIVSGPRRASLNTFDTGSNTK